MNHLKYYFTIIIFLLINNQLSSQTVFKNADNNIIINSGNLTYYNSLIYKSKLKRIQAKTLTFDKINGKKINMNSIKCIDIENTIIIKDCYWSDVKRIINSLDSNSLMENLILEKIKFDNQNEIILRYRKLKTLSFLQCDSLELIKFKFRNAKNIRLNKLDLSDCQLKNIPEFNDINADTVFLLKNPLVNIANVKFRLPRNIKYLAIDKTTQLKKLDLKKMFAFCEIYIDTSDYMEKDTEKNKIRHGVFKVTKQEQILYSGAYTQFARMLDANPYQLAIDTVMYNERFNDFSYKRLIRNNTSVNLYNIKILSKRYNKKICFELIDYKGSKDLQRIAFKDFPEYAIFRRIQWVYEKPIKKAEFIKLYKKRKWFDYRLLYDDLKNTFTFVFKTDSSFFSLEARPLYKKGRDDSNKLLDYYRNLYLNYSKKTETRKFKFNKRIATQYQTFKNASKTYLDSNWIVFSRMYLSEPEKLMSKEEWLEYYENIISDEKNILNRSFAMQTTLNRALDLMGFFNDTKLFTTQTNSVNFRLIDKDGEIQAVDNATIIDLQNLNYLNFKGGYGYNQARLFVNPAGRYVVYAELLNGDIAIVKPDDFVYNPIDGASELLFKANVIKKELSSLEQILSYFGLKL